jgi:hypothetical protein
MHARLDELLNLRDGAPVDAALHAHVRDCADCSARLAATVELRERLRALPPARALRADGWAALEARLDAVHARRRRLARLAPLAAAASIAALALFAGLRWPERDTPTVDAAASAAREPGPSQAAALAELQARSQALEAVLAALPSRPSIGRAATTLPIDSLEAQVQWLDHELTLADADGRSPQAEQLWRDRVEVMSSLVQLRYVEAQHVY